MYHNGEWWGIFRLWLDWKGDRWMLPSLLKWHKEELPEWITKEDIDESIALQIEGI
jgi:hypothetical protein